MPQPPRWLVGEAPLYPFFALPVSTERQPSLVLLIDGDNVSAKLAEFIFSQIEQRGRVVVKRIYGDWSSSRLQSWKSVLADHALVPVQQCRYTGSKNATDGRMIIDAMDLLHQGTYDAFYLVSSDSDLASLAARIRESSLAVYGIGEPKTPKPFVNAC